MYVCMYVFLFVFRQFDISAFMSVVHYVFLYICMGSLVSSVCVSLFPSCVRYFVCCVIVRCRYFVPTFVSYACIALLCSVCRHFVMNVFSSRVCM